MDETNRATPPANETHRRNIYRTAAALALMPHAYCNRRRCRRSGKCLGRFAPLILLEGRAPIDLPLCIASVPREPMDRFCSIVGTLRDAPRRTDTGLATLEGHHPDQRPWHRPPIRLHVFDPPPDAPRRRSRWLRRPAKPSTS